MHVGSPKERVWRRVHPPRLFLVLDDENVLTRPARASYRDSDERRSNDVSSLLLSQALQFLVPLRAVDPITHGSQSRGVSLTPAGCATRSRRLFPDPCSHFIRLGRRDWGAQRRSRVKRGQRDRPAEKEKLLRVIIPI